MSTVAYITARGLFGRRRVLMLLPLPLLLIGLAALCRAYDVDPDQWGQAVVVGLGLAVVLPVISLIVGTGVLGSEVDDGTIVHILTKPLPRRDIILAKLLVAAGVSALTAAVPLFVAGLLADSVRFGLALVVGAMAGAIAYSALFLLLSLVTRRPVLLGLAYILVWEGLLGRFVSGTRVLSIEQYVISIADRIAPTGMLEGKVSVPVAIVMSAVFALGGTIYAINRLGSFSVAGETS
ncbi:ABC transporter permease [Paractinoplanes brasiliensis]|uniref:ABC-2 type transport system permease protein n=1 Tax=Paractinoplanes brasiliensis TaxID=52695 RepID=A0A4V3C7R2_9ACTN|nr:ABC transporter permease [Actinoplanes brasiliensis]TDO38668.1 ABC-2 type transport system permease protein [Actinoplanes brasiliensis]GID26554.1 ABC transporter permease [Actinoplanes brasiliensis]